MIDTERLMALSAEYGVTLSPEQAGMLDRYAQLLVEWNQKMNLTAITEPEDILIKHFVDSLTVAPLLPNTPFSLIDVGTGAGFPGIPLAIVRRDMALTLLDSLNKRLVFLEEVCRALNLQAKLVHARAEEAGQKPEHRQQYDMAVARAVASLPVLCEYCLPLVKVGGRLIAMKGPEVDSQNGEEVQAGANAAHRLGAKLAELRNITLPNGDQRRLVVFEKTHNTPGNFPRPTAKIRKQPLK